MKSKRRTGVNGDEQETRIHLHCFFISARMCALVHKKNTVWMSTRFKMERVFEYST